MEDNLTDLKVPKVLPSILINGACLLGLLSALIFRSVIILKHINPDLISLAWYVAVCGYIIFFLYRYYIAGKRIKTIKDYDLLNKVSSGELLTEDESNAVLYILNSIYKSKERINYLLIFILSVIAILADLIMSYA